MKIIPMPDSLARIRIHKGLSRDALAKKANVGEQTISRIEEGKGVQAATAKKICDALEVDFHQIFEIK